MYCTPPSISSAPRPVKPGIVLPRGGSKTVAQMLFIPNEFDGIAELLASPLVDQTTHQTTNLPSASSVQMLGDSMSHRNLRAQREASRQATQKGPPARTSNPFFGVGPITNMAADEIERRALRFEFEAWVEENY